MIETNLYKGDCLRELSKIQDNSVDMILTDLPYGTTACKWDSIIELDKLWKQYLRIVKENAAIVLHAQQPFTTTLAHSNINMLRYEWIWEKPQGTNPLNAKVMPLKSHENILVFYKKKPIYNPQMWYSTPYSGFKSKTKTLGEVYGENTKSVHRDNPKGERYPKTVLKFKQETGLHPTQKPVKLAKYLIKTYTNENDTVLDSTMGSGTTGVACVETKRNFIGIELDDKYFELAKNRIKESKSKPIQTKLAL
jgi:site-specific DNA-methyltransferase (adenine-specific)|tara:strand:+ start:729 stop:1481 length:753 start_codon:yes stop_codon:yes gene_type:complete